MRLIADCLVDLLSDRHQASMRAEAHPSGSSRRLPQPKFTFGKSTEARLTFGQSVTSRLLAGMGGVSRRLERRRRGHRPHLPLVLSKRVVWVTVQPAFTFLSRGNYRMPTAVRVLAGVSVGRGVATPCSPAGLPRSQMHPAGTHLDALVTYARPGQRDGLDCGDMRACAALSSHGGRRRRTTTRRLREEALFPPILKCRRLPRRDLNVRHAPTSKSVPQNLSAHVRRFALAFFPFPSSPPSSNAC